MFKKMNKIQPFYKSTPLMHDTKNLALYIVTTGHGFKVKKRNGQI